MLQLIGLELFGAVLGGYAFVVMYQLWAPWYESVMGRHIMTLAAAMAAKDSALLLLYSGVKTPLWIFAVVYGLLNVAVWWRVGILVIEQRGGSAGMASWVYSGLRTAAQALWGILVAQAANAGITLPDWMQGWFVETVIVAGGIGLVTAGIRWLETRKGDSPGARAARLVAKLVMLGLSGKQPVYTTPIQDASPRTVTYDSSQTRTALKE